MRRLKHPVLIVLTVAAFFLATSGCGYILHPERRDRRVHSNDIDVPILIMDLLWLIPGVIPGVIALAVDITSGALYKGGAVAAVPGQEALVRVNGPAPADCEVTLRCLDRDGRDLAPAVRVQAVQGQSIAPMALRVPETVPDDTMLVVAVDGRPSLRIPVEQQPM